jgi:hypothetical protein
MRTAGELRARAAHLRELEKLVTDKRAVEAIRELIQELEQRAEAIEKEEGGSTSS